jgi:hypothetical protein
MRGRLTYANVMSTIAVFMAMGLGGAWAATHLKKNSVSSKQVKNESILSKDLKDGKAVTGGDVTDGSIASADLADGSVGSAKLADGSVGSAKLAPDEPFHLVGATGEPGFGNGGDEDCVWQNGVLSFPSNPASFYKTKDGIVRLAGNPTAMNAAGGDGLCDASDIAELIADYRMFTLPPGYRPANPERIVAAEGSGAENVTLAIGSTVDSSIPGATLPAGAVIVTNPPAPGLLQVNLDGLSFRAAGSGAGLARAAIDGTGDDGTIP